MRHVCLAFLGLVAADLHAAPAPDPGGARWWSHVAELADDRYEGRLTGTPGYDRAATYVARQFEALGLKPAGTDGYLQPVALIEQSVDEARSSVRFQFAARPIEIGADLLLGTRIRQRDIADASIVFLGYGLHLPDAAFDEFAGQDLRGKIVVTLNGGPATLSAAMKSHARAAELWPAMARAGAIGLITIANPKSMDIPWARSRVLAGQPGMRLADPALNDAKAPYFTATLNPASAEALFAGSPHRFADLLALANAGRPLPTFALAPRLTATVAARDRALISPNVAALLPGSDPALAPETVVLTGHLDHLGLAPAGSTDRVYNGAMDNASGIASLIETAVALHARPPRRSVLFLAVTAEERGLLGSRYFASRPTASAGRIVANVNMDMYLPLWPLEAVTVLGGPESNLGPVADAAAITAGITTRPDDRPDRNLFVRSDQYSFIRTGVPALSLKFAATTASAQALSDAFLRDRYHGVADDAAQPVDKAAAARFNIFLVDLIGRVADMPQRPRWNADSFFRRFASEPAPTPAASGT